MNTRAWLLTLALCGLGCRKQEPAPDPGPKPVHVELELERPQLAMQVEQPAYLDGALLEASYDTTMLAQLVGSLPRPSLDDAPLVSVFGHIVDALLGDAAARLEAVGLQPDARIELSVRALDGRAAAVRKLLRELSSDKVPAPELVAQLSSEARALGVHLRASLPTSDRTRLLRALAGLTISDDDVGKWADACAQLEDVALCSARPRVMLWARPHGEDRLLVDAIYLFHDGVSSADLERALARADDWPSRRERPEFSRAAPFELRMYAAETLTLLETEALADAAVAFADPEQHFNYHAYLDLEQGLRELVPELRVFDGLDVDLRYDPVGDRMTISLAWLGALRGQEHAAALFEPIIERGTLPVLAGDCAMAQACVRVAGISSVARFAVLAAGPFADSTGATRILRQAGERGPILLGLASWPNLLGTAGRMAEPAAGVVGKTQSSLISDSFGVGLMVLELGDDPDAALGERYVAYLRLGAEALAAVRPATVLAGVALRPIELDADAALVERGSWEDTPVYLVDEGPRRGGFGGWLLAADTDARVDWLLDTPREAREPAAIDPIAHVRIASLGPIAARERIAYSDDPPVRAWLDGRSLELNGRFGVGGPTVEIVLGPAK